MNDSEKRFGSRKVAITILLISLVTFAVVYALIQTRSGLAVLTSPPPGIPGPYYVTAEAKIYGPVVDLAKIKSWRVDTTYAPDYTYVQWGSNPFYRIYIDNTFQVVRHGQLTDVMQALSQSFGIENALNGAFNDLKDAGVMDLYSQLGGNLYFGNMPGVLISIFSLDGTLWPGTLTTRNSYWYATSGWSYHSNGWVEVRLNNTQCLYLLGLAGGSNVTGSSASLYYWNFSGQAGAAITLYFEDLLYMETTISSEAIRAYNVSDSPGTAFVTKHASPSPRVGTTINVTVRLDPPIAEKLNITDLYPNAFTWASVDVLLEKFKVGTGLEESVYVNVVPVPDGPDMTFTIFYNQAPSILQSLQSDEYIHLTYSLLVPDVAGEYTLPAATMSYLIPTP